MKQVLSVSGLTKSYGRLRAADDVSFEIGAGEVLALLGPNGSGKTTTLRCIAGLLRPDCGSISIGGFDLRRHYRQARREFSYLPQHASFTGNLRVREVLQFHASLRGLPSERVDGALLEAGLSEADAARLVGQLSGGMRQRVSLAVACLPAAGLMLFDEPTANLDPEAALHFRQLAKGWRAAGRSILLSTHVLTDVEELADSVVVMVGGCMVARESIADLRRRLSLFSRLRVDVGQATEQHRAAALEAGAVEARLNTHALIVTAPVEHRLAILQSLENIDAVNRFDTEQPTLEDVYLEYVRGEEQSDV
jgi:ABC-type multidrug transport system ATPase subunit